MPKISFTDLTIKALKPGVYFDTKTPAFGIRVGKNRRTWLVLKGARSIKVLVGHYPALSLADARRLALIALGSPYVARTAPRFPDALDQFLALDRWRPGSQREIARTLRRHFKWETAIDKITHDDVASVIDGIEAPSEANHAFKDIRTFFNWCVPRYLKHSPCSGLKMPHKSETRARILTDAEIKAVWTAAENMEGHFGTIVKLLLLTGQRRTEIGALQSSWIHENKITLPKEITKNAREHSFPIGSLAASVLKSPNKISDGHFLFPARGGSGASFKGWSASKVTLDALSGVEKWTLHDLRRSFASGLAALGIRLEVIERILNHVSGSFGGVAGIYTRYDFWPEQVVAIEMWEQRLIAILQPF